MRQCLGLTDPTLGTEDSVCLGLRIKGLNLHQLSAWCMMSHP